jgi:membrane protease YdiL (CAAX protease family)
MVIADAAASAAAQVIILAGGPLLAFAMFHRIRHDRPWREIAERAGLQVGRTIYLAYSLAFTIFAVAVAVLWPPPLELLAHGTARQRLLGQGFGGTAMLLAFLHGVIQTGFAEELVFRGLITGSLARRMSLLRANIAQAGIFLLPHLAILIAWPDAWWILPVVFVSALFFGWIRIMSGSMLGSWIAHGALNFTAAMIVAVRSAG